MYYLEACVLFTSDAVRKALVRRSCLERFVEGFAPSYTIAGKYPSIVDSHVPWYLIPGTWYLVPGTWYLVFMCGFFTVNRSFYPSTSRTTNVRADSSITTPAATKLSHRDDASSCTKQSRQCNVMLSHRIRQARHTHAYEKVKIKIKLERTKNRCTSIHISYTKFVEELL